MPLQSNGPAPYAPASTVLEVIRRYRDHGLTSPFTLDVLARAGVPESLGPRTLQALKLLELISEEGEPTEAFTGIATTPEAEYRERFAALVRGVYAEVFSFVDPAQEPNRVRDAFRSFTPRGQQERMVRLFLGLAAHAGIVPETAARVASPRNGATGRVIIRKDRAASTKKSTGGRGAAVPQGLPPALAGLIEEMVSIGPSWNAEQQERFLSAFQSMVDYSYPVQQMVAKPADEEDDGA